MFPSQNKSISLIHDWSGCRKHSKSGGGICIQGHPRKKTGNILG